MVPTDVVVCSMIFPAAAAVVGAYLVRRGMRNLAMGKASVVCGKVKCKKPIKSIAAGRTCAVFHTFVESRKRGRWSTIFSTACGTEFMLGKSRIGGGTAYLKTSNPSVFQGTVPHREGVIGGCISAFKGTALYRSASDAISMFFPVRPAAQQLETSVFANLKREQSFASALKRSNPSHLRVTEHVLLDGMRACAVSGQEKKGRIMGTTEFPIILSDMGPADAERMARGRGWLSIFAGASLLALSLLVILFLTQRI